MLYGQDVFCLATAGYAISRHPPQVRGLPVRATVPLVNLYSANENTP